VDPNGWAPLLIMSNSAKQREFLKKAVKTIEDLGCEVSIEQNKHYKIKIRCNNQVGIWGVSTTPKNRYTAQRDAISELKTVLRSIGLDLSNQNFGAGLLHMQINKPNITQILDALIEKEDFMNPNLFKGLLHHSYPNLTIENQNSILTTYEMVQKIISSSSESSSIQAPDWVVLSPSGNPPNACVRNMMTLASDRNRFALQWRDSYRLTDAIEAMLAYYKVCGEITKLGVLVTNVWRPGELSRYRMDIENYEANGTQTIAILISGNSALPISWHWR
jgi:hypothetical protein